MRGLVVNLLGPPGVGKSAFASRYILEHPYFTYTSIDAHRAEDESELNAWSLISETCLDNKKVIVESCGLSWRLNELINNIKKRDKRNIISIAMIGDEDILYQRIDNRHKRIAPKEYFIENEIESIGWVLKNLDKIEYKIDYYIDTTRNSFEEVYMNISKQIAKARLER